MFWAELALGALALTSALQDPAAGVIRGEVRSERTGDPIPMATVAVAGSLVPIVATADSLGAYVLRGVPAGRQLLRAEALSHGPLEVEVFVPAGREVRVDFTLPLQPLEMPGLTALDRRGATGVGTDTTASAGGGEDDGGPELGRAVVRSLEATSGIAELGLTEITRALNPGQEPVDPSDVLFVRGAPTDLKLVLLDGAPIYAPFQMGGLLPAFGSDQVGRAELFLGGAPARYDGALSYVLDLETRPGDRTGWRHSGTADLLMTEALVEGPLGSRSSLMLGGRAVHGLGADWILRERFPYGYGDALGRLDLALGARSSLAVTGYWNQESVHLDDITALGAEWGNRAGSLRYRGALLGREAEVTLALGRYGARLPIGGTMTRRVLADGLVQQARAGVELSGGNETLGVRYGISYERTEIEQRVWSTTEEWRGVAERGGMWWRGEGSTRLLESNSTGEMGGAYVDLEWSATPRLRVQGGARASLFSVTPQIGLSPRLAVIWALSDRAVLKVAGGRYRQLVRANTLVPTESPDYVVEDLRAPHSLELAQSSHFLLGLDQMLADELRLGIEGYFKRFDGIPIDEGSTLANASGLDLWVRRSQGRVTGWLGYSLGWVWASASDQWSTTTQFTGRQLLSLGVSGTLGEGGKAEVRVGYGAGVPFASLPVGDLNGLMSADRSTSAANTVREAHDIVLEAPPVATAPDAPYLRLDAEISYLLNTEWFGARVRVTPYLKIYNALDRRDAFFYRKDDAAPGVPRPLAALPLLPVLGVQWKF